MSRRPTSTAVLSPLFIRNGDEAVVSSGTNVLRLVVTVESGTAKIPVDMLPGNRYSYMLVSAYRHVGGL